MLRPAPEQDAGTGNVPPSPVCPRWEQGGVLRDLRDFEGPQPLYQLQHWPRSSSLFGLPAEARRSCCGGTQARPRRRELGGAEVGQPQASSSAFSSCLCLPTKHALLQSIQLHARPRHTALLALGLQYKAGFHTATGLVAPPRGPGVPAPPSPARAPGTFLLLLLFFFCLLLFFLLLLFLLLFFLLLWPLPWTKALPLPSLLHELI